MRASALVYYALMASARGPTCEKSHYARRRTGSEQGPERHDEQRCSLLIERARGKEDGMQFHPIAFGQG